MVLYAAGQIPPKGNDKMPVGFGSNIEGKVPSDFNYAGSSWEPISHSHDDDDWGDKAEDILEKAPSKKTSGFFFFILVLLLLAFLLRKKERRMRWYSRLSSVINRSRRPGSPRKGRGLAGLTSKLFRRHSTQYERVMEEGEASMFELGEVDSDENDHSDSSEGSRFGRTSGLATPKLTIENFDDPKPASALDRSGLVVRTESRERLVPTLSMLSAGRRSRAGSPTRQKSPLMTPLQED